MDARQNSLFHRHFCHAREIARDAACREKFSVLQHAGWCRAVRAPAQSRGVYTQN
jgi:hypothetical protein